MDITSRHMEELLLSADELGYLLDAADYIERRFDVTIETPGREGYKPGEVVMAIVHGQKTNVVSSLKYIKSRFFPEESKLFWYIKELEVIYGNPLWTQTLEKIHSVWIQNVLYGKLLVSGSKTSVTSAISAMSGLVRIFKFNNVTSDSNAKYFTDQIAEILLNYTNVEKVENIVKQIDHLPSDVKKILMWWTKEAYVDENSARYDFCLSSPEKKTPPVITLLDSDDDSGIQIVKASIKSGKQRSILQLNQCQNVRTSQVARASQPVLSYIQTKCKKPLKHGEKNHLKSIAVKNKSLWYYISPRKNLQPPSEEYCLIGEQEGFTFSSIGAICM